MNKCEYIQLMTPGLSDFNDPYFYMKATVKLVSVVVTLIYKFFDISSLPLCLIQGADISKAGGDFLPWGFPSRLQRARVICYVRRDTRFGGRKRRERERENAISRPAGA